MFSVVRHHHWKEEKRKRIGFLIAKFFSLDCYLEILLEKILIFAALSLSS